MSDYKFREQRWKSLKSEEENETSENEKKLC